MSQYALSLSLPPVFTAENFIVSGCNREAWQWINAWPDWPSHALLLHGAEGSGKSHLGHIWAARAGANIVPAAELAAVPAPGNWLIEDIENMGDQRRLLHWFNHARENGGNLLLTSAQPAAQLPFTLPDLTSRLLALPGAFIDQPDDEVLAGAMRKQFADRQMTLGEDVIAYLLPRMERSLEKLQSLVALLDTSALAEKKNITIPFVKKVLEAANRG